MQNKMIDRSDGRIRFLIREQNYLRKEQKGYYEYL